MQRAHGVVCCKFEVFKTTVWLFGSVGIFMHHSFHALSGNGVFREESKGVEEWFEVRLANE
jgi:hypothetical protein